MKKLKILLLFSCLLLLFFKLNKTTNYNGNETKVVGIIAECKSEDKYTKIVINSLEPILVYYYDNYICKLGDKVEVTGKLSKIDSNRNFNLFNYQKYMLSKGIYWKMTADKINLINENKNILYNIKNKIIEKTKINTYLELFILGNNNLDDEIKESYQINGISHLFAISGMHVTLFITILSFILNKISKRHIINEIIIILFLIFYMFLTNFSVSIVRASLISILLILNKILKLKISSLKLLIYIFIFCICYNPFYIYQVGFIFTFLITFTFIIFSKDISKYKNYFIKLLLTSSLAFLVSIPILINNFFSVNFLTPILNLFFIPLITFIIFPLSILCFIFPFLLPILEKLTMILEQISIWCSEFQILTFSFSRMNIIFIIIYYLVIYIGIYYFFKKKLYILILLPILIFHYNLNLLKIYSTLTMIDQRTTNMIPIICRTFERNPLILGNI